jgi:hypothetical protein
MTMFFTISQLSEHPIIPIRAHPVGSSEIWPGMEDFEQDLAVFFGSSAGTLCAYFDISVKSRWRGYDASKSDALVIKAMDFFEDQNGFDHDNAISLQTVYRFHKLVTTQKETFDVENRNIVLVTGPLPRIQFVSMFLLGGHLLIRGFSLQDVMLSFSRFKISRMRCFYHDLSCFDLWSAFSRAQEFQFLDFNDCFETPCAESAYMHIEEYLHYARYPPTPPLFYSNI